MALAEAYLAAAKLDSALHAYIQAARTLPADSSSDDQERARLRRSVRRRIHYLKQVDRYEGYNGAYELAGQAVVFKFDPYLNTFPQLLDLRSGFIRVLYPVAPSHFHYLEWGGSPGGVVRFLQPAGADKLVLEWQPRGDKARSFVRTTRSIPVSFRSDQHALSGTLYLPASNRPMAAVAFAQGSGASTRFSISIEAIALAEAGAAALVFDKRGTGRSEGPAWHALGLEAQAADVTAAVDFLQSHEITKGLPIGAWGFSQGGWVVPLVATRSAAVAFVMLAAGPAVTLTEQTVHDVEYEMRTDGRSEAEIQSAAQFQRDLFAAISAGKSAPELQAMALPSGSSTWLRFINRPQFQFEVDWWRSNLYDPSPVIQQLKVPLLAIYGALDHAVPPRENVPRLSQLLANAPTRDYTITIVPRANHLFMEGKTGSRREFGQLGQYSAAYFRTMREWLRSHFLIEANVAQRE
jgi:alpha-beta hydrolase superfamily lysophospholipase